MRLRVAQPLLPVPHWQMSAVGVVLPAYNEQEHVADAVAACLAQGPGRIVCVDDASTDRTAQIIRGLAARQDRVEAAHHAINQGKQGAVRTGLRQLLRHREVEAVAVIDADMQNDPAHLPKLCCHLAAHDVVIGVRRQGEMPRVRRLANALANLPYRTLAGVALSDVQSGFRVYRRDVAAYLEEHMASSGRYALEHTSMLLLGRLARERRQEVRLAEVSIPCRYGRAASHIRVRDNVQLTWASVYHALALALLRL